MSASFLTVSYRSFHPSQKRFADQAVLDQALCKIRLDDRPTRRMAGRFYFWGESCEWVRPPALQP